MVEATRGLTHARDAGVTFIYTPKEKRTPCHPGAQLLPGGSLGPGGASSQFSRMGSPQEGPHSCRDSERQALGAAAHNRRRPRRRVHLTSQIHNSLTLCRVKRRSATVLMDTDKWPPEETLRDLPVPHILRASYPREERHS